MLQFIKLVSGLEGGVVAWSYFAPTNVLNINRKFVAMKIKLYVTESPPTLHPLHLFFC